MKKNTFGRNLRKIREIVGINATELADRSGLTQAAISQIESGKRDPSLSSIIAILSVIPTKFEILMTEIK